MVPKRVHCPTHSRRVAVAAPSTLAGSGRGPGSRVDPRSREVSAGFPSRRLTIRRPQASRPAALLHDTIEDTETSYDERRGQFGARIADIVAEVTDTKFLGKQSRKRLQLSKAGRASAAAQQVNSGHAAKAVVEQVRGANPKLAAKFDAVWEAGRGWKKINQLGGRVIRII
jgi:hypothetical protein